MKNAFLILSMFAIGSFCTINATVECNILDRNVFLQQDTLQIDYYSYGPYKLPKNQMIENMREHAKLYLGFQVRVAHWTSSQCEEFQKVYSAFIDALKNPQSKIYTDDFGNIHFDSNVVKYIGESYWYDKQGCKISEFEYSSLSPVLQAQYKHFSALEEFVTFMNGVCQTGVNALYRK